MQRLTIEYCHAKNAGRKGLSSMRMKYVYLSSFLILGLMACSGGVQQPQASAQTANRQELPASARQVTHNHHLYDMPLTCMSYWVKRLLHR